MLQAKHTLVSFIGLGSRTAAPLLYSYINEHPNSFVLEQESKFFSDEKRYQAGVASYEALYSGHLPNQVCGELAAGYLERPGAAQLIARSYPDAKLLAVIENPLVSVRVEYLRAKRARVSSARGPLSEFLKNNPEVLLRARYGRMLVPYFHYYATTDLLVVAAADVREEPIKTLQAVYTHLGLDANFVPLSLKHLIVEEEDNEKRKPGFIKRFFLFIKKLIKAAYHEIGRRFKPPKIPVENLSAEARALPLSPEMEAFLKDYYRADVAELSNLLHRNFLAEWGFVE